MKTKGSGQETWRKGLSLTPWINFGDLKEHNLKVVSLSLIIIFNFDGDMRVCYYGNKDMTQQTHIHILLKFNPIPTGGPKWLSIQYALNIILDVLRLPDFS